MHVLFCAGERAGFMEGKDSSRTEESSMHDERPHGYTLADEELERVHEKSMW